MANVIKVVLFGPIIIGAGYLAPDDWPARVAVMLAFIAGHLLGSMWPPKKTG